jgi:hypothetical protein
MFIKDTGNIKGFLLDHIQLKLKRFYVGYSLLGLILDGRGYIE